MDYIFSGLFSHTIMFQYHIFIAHFMFKGLFLLQESDTRKYEIIVGTPGHFFDS